MNNGNNTRFLIGKAAGFAKKRALLKFNLSVVPTTPAPTILNAQMKLYYYSANNGGSGSWADRWVQAHQVLVNWNEAQATKDNRLTGTLWNVAYVGLNDIDAKSGYESTMLFQTGQTGTWKIWDLTALTQKWVNGSATNYGVVLWATNEATDGYDLRFYSSEYTVDPTKVPKLEIIYFRKARTVYFLKDHLGSIRATVWDTLNAPVVGYDDYDPWGYILANRSQASSELPTTTRNKFTEKEWDDEFGLNWNYFGARYYDPLIGRWLSVDPMAEKFPMWSPYHYAFNNPLRVIDPTGLAGKDVNDESRKPNEPKTIQHVADKYSIYRHIERLYGSILDIIQGRIKSVPRRAKDDLKKAGKGAKEVAKTVAKKSVQVAKVSSDAISDGSNVVAATGILLAPFTDGATLALTAKALAVGTVADVNSTLAKGAEYAFFDGSEEAFESQLLQTAISVGSGKITSSLGAQFVVRNSPSIIGPLFRDPTTGRFVTNTFGFTVSAVRDATDVIINFVSPP